MYDIININIVAVVVVARIKWKSMSKPHKYGKISFTSQS